MIVSFLFSALVGGSIALPGGPPVGMDYLAYDAAHGRVWVPAGNTGNVDVIDVSTGKVTAVGGFPTAPPRRPGRPRMGPSSVAVGDGVVWIGNRANDTICSVNSLTAKLGACFDLPPIPDGLAYVSATHEVWVTTPRDRTINIVNFLVQKTAAPATIKLEGNPEGLAVDAARAIFYTNLEDKDRTLAIDVKKRTIVANWAAGCGADGPRGLAIDEARGLLFVACTDGAVARDLRHGGKEVGRLKTAAGVDNIDYSPKRGLLFVASGKDGTLTSARVDTTGALKALGSYPTASGARCVVADGDGTAYVADSAGGRVIVVKPPSP